MRLDALPLAGVLISLAAFGQSASLYPGGYDWTHHFLCTLFAPSTATGAVNNAKPVAVFAMFVMCVSVAVLFKRLSMRPTSRLDRKALEIGGIGSMVYGFLVVTPMHDLLVGIALLFFLPAMLAALHWTRAEARPALFWTGLTTLILLLATAVMYYGQVFWHVLPLAQKASFVACIVWLLTLQIVTGKPIGEDKGVV